MADFPEAGLQPVEPSPATKTNLDLVNECDNFPYPDTDPEAYTSHISTYYHLFIPPCPTVLGYMLPSVALTLKGIPGWTLDEKDRTLTLDLPKLPPATSTKDTASTSPPDNATTRTSTEAAPPQSDDPTEVPPSSTSTSSPNDDNPETPNPTTLEAARTATLSATTTAMRTTNHFAVLRKWRNELYPIYWRDPQSPNQKTLLASIERAASPLFGVVTYGVHMTAFTRTAPGGEKGAGSGEDAEDDGKGEGKGMWLYVPRRAPTKQTYPSLLDQTVAGGISTGESALESLVREAEEEACLPAELVRRKARAVGVVSYFHVRDERAGGETRLLQPECQFCYDLDLTGERGDGEGREGREGVMGGIDGEGEKGTSGDGETTEITPRVGDPEEVGAFELLSVAEVQAALSRGEFKPNCALVVLDFLVRHGIITRENETNYVEICQRLRRRLEFPVL